MYSIPSLNPAMLLADVNKDSFWFPPKASTFAEETDVFFMYILWISIFFFTLIVVGMVYFAWKFRRRPGYKGDSSALHNNALEITWTVIPTLVVIWIFARGVYGYMDMVTPPSDTIDINVTGKKWDWQFQYPNGAISDELHVPVNRAVRLRMRSIDVLHSFYVPAFRAKTDLVPGRVTTMWFQPIKEGVYDLFCAEYCGDNHSQMIKQQGVFVTSMEEYEAWMADAAKPPTHPIAHGYWLYNLKCKSCHSLKEGVRVVGPSYAKSYGQPVKLATGETVDFDDNYIRESILNPLAKAREGYQNASQMPSFQGQLTETELTALTEFIRRMADQDFIDVVADDDGLTKEEAIALGYGDAEDDTSGMSTEADAESGSAATADEGTGQEEDNADAAAETAAESNPDDA